MKRLKIITEVMPSVSKDKEQMENNKWEFFTAILATDERIEFNEGDVGLSGGVQVLGLWYLTTMTFSMTFSMCSSTWALGFGIWHMALVSGIR